MYKLSSHGIKKTLRRAFLRLFFPFSIIVPAIFFFPAIRDQLDSGFSQIFFLVSFLLLFLGCIMYSAMKKNKKILEAYRLEIQDDSVIAHQLAQADIVISKSEITHRQEINREGLLLLAPNKSIFIPEYLENFDEMKKEIQTLGTLEIVTRKKTAVVQALLPFLMAPLVVAAFLITFSDTDSSIALPTAIVLFFTLLSGSIFVSKNWKRYFKSKWNILILLLPLFSIGLRIVSLLGNK